MLLNTQNLANRFCLWYPNWETPLRNKRRKIILNKLGNTIYQWNFGMGFLTGHCHGKKSSLPCESTASSVNPAMMVCAFCSETLFAKYTRAFMKRPTFMLLFWKGAVRPLAKNSWFFLHPKGSPASYEQAWVSLLIHLKFYWFFLRFEWGPEIYFFLWLFLNYIVFYTSGA